MITNKKTSRSEVEEIKDNSNFLHGTLVQSLDNKAVAVGGGLLMHQITR
jgi:hypothetical protein